MTYGEMRQALMDGRQFLVPTNVAELVRINLKYWLDYKDLIVELSDDPNLCIFRSKEKT